VRADGSMNRAEGSKPNRGTANRADGSNPNRGITTGRRRKDGEKDG
jgi:hypothetical protein